MELRIDFPSNFQNCMPQKFHNLKNEVTVKTLQKFRILYGFPSKLHKLKLKKKCKIFSQLSLEVFSYYQIYLMESSELFLQK